MEINALFDDSAGFVSLSTIHRAKGLEAERVFVLEANMLPLSWSGQRPDQARLWDQTTGLYTSPVNQPIAIAADENIWSGAHAQLNDAQGTVLLHGGFMTGGGAFDGGVAVVDGWVWTATTLAAVLKSRRSA